MKVHRYSDKSGSVKSLGLELHWSWRVPKWMKEARQYKSVLQIVLHFGSRTEEWYIYFREV